MTGSKNSSSINSASGNRSTCEFCEPPFATKIFQREAMAIYERNPIVYARAADVNIYIKRNFAPLEDRVHSIVAIESQVPNILIAARTNLDPVLPKPYVELAIRVAKGRPFFCGRIWSKQSPNSETNVCGPNSWKQIASSCGPDRLCSLARDGQCEGHRDFALGQEKFQRLLKETELGRSSARKVLEIGLTQLRKEQKLSPTLPRDRFEQIGG